MLDSGGVSVTICARCANVMSGKKNSPSSVGKYINDNYLWGL